MRFHLILTLIVLHLTFSISHGQQDDQRGFYFAKKKYSGEPLPSFESAKEKLPTPILTDNSEWIDMYWKSWEIAFQHFKVPPKDSPFVSNILDEAFNENIFQWDMIFMVMFARYGNDIFPAINSLDNFYCRQHKSGYICREISEVDGSDFIYLSRNNTINPPLFSWAEVESFMNTGDTSRLKQFLPVLEKYVEWLSQEGDLTTASDEYNWEKYGRKAANSVHELYWNTPLGSGMDNTPRSGDGWVDMSCQMVIQYNNLAEICSIIGNKSKAELFREQAKDIADRINRYCWNENDGLYYDVDSEGNHIKWKTSGCFWPMLAGITSEEQNTRLVAHLQDTSSFWRRNVFPTLAADQQGYNPNGGYWLGSVWAPTNYAIIKGLEKIGYNDFARKASIRYIEQLQCVFDSTGTLWENYSPDYCAPGNQSKPDFVGWTGIGPISLLIENILGIRVSAHENTLTWHISRTDFHGIENLKVGKTNISLTCEERDNYYSPLSLDISVNNPITFVIVIDDISYTYDLDAGYHAIFYNP